MVLVVDASHAARLAEQLAKMVPVDTITTGDWRAGKLAGENLASAVTSKLWRQCLPLMRLLSGFLTTHLSMRGRPHSMQEAGHLQHLPCGPSAVGGAGEGLR